MHDINRWFSFFLKKLFFLLCILYGESFSYAAVHPDAKQTSLDTQPWKLDPGRHALTHTTSSMVLPHLALSGIAAFQHSGVSVSVAEDTRTLRMLAGYRTELTLGGAVGLWNMFEVGTTLPIVMYQKSQFPGALLGSLPSAGMGDIGLYAKASLYTFKKFPLGISVMVPFSVPSGNAQAFMGYGTVTTEPQLLLSTQWKQVFLNMAWGYAVQPKRSFFTLYTHNAVTTHVSLLYQNPKELWKAGIEWHVASNPSHYMENLHTKSTLMASGEYRLTPSWGLFASAGAGLFSGIGTPSYHFTVGASFYTSRWSDFDKDGLSNHQDTCPNDPEDIDFFEDNDGCPETDNDKDTLPDSADKCPLQPEDKDQFEDEDGCPETDNDKDGFPDTQDPCPNEAATMEDNPAQPGCPKAKEPVVEITPSHIEVRMEPMVFFKHGYMRVSRGFHILDAIAETLKNNPHILKIRIEGYADESGPPELNMHVSQRRAESVKNHLIQRGIAPERLEAKGMGESNPRDAQSKNKQSQENRRVELVIIEQNQKASAPEQSTQP